MNALQRILALSDVEKTALGLTHTAHEIAQQPETWHATAKLIDEQRLELQAFLRIARDQKRTIFLIGAGSSDYVGACFAPLLRQQWGCEVIVAPSTSLLTHRDEWMIEGKRYLWISFSRSGASPEGVAVLERALHDLPDTMHLVVTCNASGAMASLVKSHKQAHAVVLDDAVNDRSLAMTSSFTNMVMVGQMISTLWSNGEFAAALTPMCAAAEFLLNTGADVAAEIVSAHPQRACFIGSGVLAAAAREAALKLVELTAGRTLTMSESTLGLRHGPMSALNLQTALTCFVSGEGSRKQYDLDLLAEVAAKQTTQNIVAIGAEASVPYVLTCSAFAKIADAYRTPVDVIFGQLLGFFASLDAGLKPDAPSPQGVISRVVPPFQIYR